MTCESSAIISFSSQIIKTMNRKIKLLAQESEGKGKLKKEEAR